MEPTLPVWSIRPNWKGGILERLEWLTDVITSSSGAEQRRALRLSPRRSFEITINPTQNERTFVDLLLHKLGSSDWLFPVWIDKARLAASVEEGDERITFDNTYREHGVGGLALLYKDAWTWEVVSIGGQDANGLDLDVPLDGDWTKGTSIYPLRQARLQNETELNALSSRVGEAVLLWTMVEANEWPAISPDDQIFEGMPVLTTAPNRSSTLTTNHTRLAVDRDNMVGIPYRRDPAGRAFQVQSHSFMRHGRQQQAAFRSMLYWLRGRQRALWLPSFNEDIVASRASVITSTNLDVQKIGIAYAGGVVPGRDVVRINGTPARITALGAPQSPQEERLRVGAGLTAAVPKGARGSFLSPARLNQDSVELLHHADSDGAMECSTTFKTFSNTRDAAGAIYFPIPDSDMSAGGCGNGLLDLPGNSSGPNAASAGGQTYDVGPGEYLLIQKPDILTWPAWSFTPESPYGMWGYNNWTNTFTVQDAEGNVTTHWGLGDVNYNGVTFGADPKELYTTPELAYGSVVGREVILTGSAHYTIFLLDATVDDNRGGLSVTVTKRRF
jgi:hypothetical protein